ncbi:MAG: DNA circularization N-terminal domain-containing protein [Deltaproteobacteria bacterium]|nr:DNA circularization N-terminal domain-containing protein [Deltaproteobacteria bacterium]
MPWNDRLREAAYTSPSGVRTVFDYEDVRKTIDKKTTGFEFPDADGTLVQDLGHSGRRYPLRIIFWGDDHDIDSDAFEAALIERGVGKLEHPVYGTVDVVPFGTITRNDQLKTAANQSIIELVFWETIGVNYPVSQTDPASSILSSVDEYNAASATEFEDVTNLETATEQSSLKNKYTAFTASVKSGLSAVADTQEDVQKQFDTINNSITQGMDLLIGQPLTLAFQTAIMIQAPARALTSIRARLDAYRNLANSFITGDDAISTDANDFHAKDVFASTSITGSIVSVVNNQFDTKTEALEAAEAILDQFEAVQTWRDDNFNALSATEIDTGSAYQQLQEAVALTAGFLVQISFTLKQERIVVLDRARTPVDLVAEFYGSIDDQLDFFINSNNLSGSEILEISRGRSVAYYI